MTGAVVLFGLWSAGDFAHAQTAGVLQQTDQSVVETHDTAANYTSQWGQGFNGLASGVSVVYDGLATSTPSSGSLQFSIQQYSDAGYGSLVGVCAYTTTNYNQPTAVYTWNTLYTTYGFGCTLYPTSYVQIQVLAPYNYVFSGTATQPANVTTGNVPAGLSVLIPYFQVQGVSGSPDWSLITTPPPFTLGTTSAAIAASSSLWASLTLASSSAQCDTGNLFSDGLCAAGAYLFVPAPSTFEEYASLPQTEQGHWPFSWIFGVESQIDTATSTTGNLPAWSLDLNSAASTTFASTTMPNFLPSFTFFSSTTVMTFLQPSQWDAMQALLAAVLWLGLVVDIFFVLRNRFHRV